MNSLSPRLVLSIALVAPALVACGARQSQVEMKGGDNDLVTVVGQWEGTYTGAGRSGRMYLNLDLGRHTAEGTVLMDGETPLQISFIEVEGGAVAGKMAPYTDPTCKCQVVTTFTGSQAGDSMTGSFTVKALEGDLETHGEWSAVRK